MTRDSSPDDGRGTSVDSESYDRSNACGNEDARQHREAVATEALASLQAQLAEALSAASTANAELAGLRTEHRQLTLAESSCSKTATSETAAARKSRTSALEAVSLLKTCKAELAEYGTRLRQSECEVDNSVKAAKEVATATLKGARDGAREHQQLVQSMQKDHEYVIEATQSTCNEEIVRQTARMSECQQRLREETEAARDARAEAAPPRYQLG